MPHTIVVSPMRTSAEPSAVPIEPKISYLEHIQLRTSIDADAAPGRDLASVWSVALREEALQVLVWVETLENRSLGGGGSRCRRSRLV